MKDQNIVSEEEMYAFCFVQLLNLSNYERVQKSVWVYTGGGMGGRQVRGTKEQ